MTRLVLLALLVLALGAPARGQVQPPLPNVGPPLLLRLEGEFRPTLEEAKKERFPVVTMGFLGEQGPTRFFVARKALTVGGDHPLLGKDVLALVAPFDPNFLVTGPDKMVAALRDAPPGVPVRVEGLVSRGSRTYYLRTVEVGATD